MKLLCYVWKRGEPEEGEVEDGAGKGEGEEVEERRVCHLHLQLQGLRITTSHHPQGQRDRERGELDSP